MGVWLYGQQLVRSSGSNPSRAPSTHTAFHPRIVLDPEMYTQPSLAACCSLVTAGLVLLCFIFTVEHDLPGKLGWQ